MKGIDTNVLVRYLVQDDAQQSQYATHFIEKECSISTPGFISGIVFCELVWVLESAYEYSREQIFPVLEKLLRARQLQIHEPHIIWSSLRGYKNDGADFADHYIRNLNAHNHCEHTVTFDKKAARLSGFELLGK